MTVADSNTHSQGQRPCFLYIPLGRWFALSIAVLMLGIVVIDLGLPIDTWTWFGLGIGMIPIIVLWRRHFLPIGVVGTTFLYYLTFFVPLERHVLQDVHGGRYGWLVLPHGFRFGHPGPNTRLLEERLGPMDAQWRHRCVHFMLLAIWRDGNERVNCRNLIFSERLPAILERLPNDEARRQVLLCLTDSANLLRIHQGLLLTALNEMGYPPGMDTRTWWNKHAWVFQRERDPAMAVQITWGWTTRLPKDLNNDAILSQLRGVQYQQRGAWGGDVDFGEAYFKFEEVMDRGGNKNDPALGVNRISWWPK